MKPLNLNLHLSDGSPDGVIIIRIPGWSGECIKFSKSDTREAIKRYEEDKNKKHCGVYFLFGYSGEQKQRVYIGQSDDIAQRIKGYIADKRKSWVERIIVFTSDKFLNVKNLEYELIREINKELHVLSNGNKGGASNLSEFEHIDVSNFLEHIKLIMPLLGFHNLFAVTENMDINSNDKSIFVYKKARGILLHGKFRILKGSKIERKEVPSCSESIKSRRERLIKVKIINEKLEFSEDFDFDSPSGAGAIVYGGSVNGWDVWKNKNGETLNQITQRKIISKK